MKLPVKRHGQKGIKTQPASQEKESPTTQSPNLGEPAEATMPAEQWRVVVNGGGRRPLKARTSTSQLGHVHAVQRRVVVSGEGCRPQPANQDKAPTPTKAPKKGRDDLRTNGTVKAKKENQEQTKHQSKVQGNDLRERRREREKERKRTRGKPQTDIVKQ